jgi:Spy/CpxP family protein refolding chaperone
MNNLNKNKWQIRLAAVLIFLLGVTAGALAPRAYHGWHRSGGAQRGPEGFDQMLERLQLSDEQRTQVRQILGDTRGQLEALRKESEPKVAQIRQQTDERLQQVLTPAQWQQFQQMREEMRARHRRNDGRDGDARATEPSASNATP